ncbi:DUF4424 domain-containing protein [Roseococcus sp. SDR]|uniref:DUF4424 family protein n=1 Tax=Roseococcus sp. SDR TaxID=2835532 RepID=UPI001BD0C3C1|nr:DUF4424 family protein [Roseococcus sp. SDR]MBS7788469.1 DUF4424 family protein [Roseococcus sp. SDR]MBV1843783.1 DUF4424 domain-containing protein [Roseococcus sp. SDR]
MLRSALGLAALFLLALPRPAPANDSMAAIGIGGLALVRSEAVRLDRQELFISRERVRVEYLFTNTTDRDIDTLVAFPLPDFTHSPVDRVPDFRRELDFRTVVEGRPVTYELVQRAHFKGQDITDRLRALGLPLVGGDEFERRVNDLPEPQRAALLRDGLVLGAFEQGRTNIDEPLWTVSTSVTRRQVFPAGRSLAVQHSYVPFAGGSVGGRLSPERRGTSEFRALRARYCMEDGFLAAFDRRIQRARRGADYGEIWLQYRLTPGANWAGPIREFRLVIEKPDPSMILSFCGEGVRRLDDRRFEMRRTNFTPERDLDILFVEFVRP